MNPVSERWKLLLRPLKWVPEPLRMAATGVLSPAYRLGAACLFVDEQGRWLLARHSYRAGWGLPGGTLDRGEHPAECARREMREELGVEVRLGAGVVHLDPDIRRGSFLYRAVVVSGTPEIRTAEIEEIAWWHPDEIEEHDDWLLRVQPLLGQLPPPDGDDGVAYADPY